MDCDAMIWAGKASAAGLEGVNIEAAQYPAVGKFGRRPEPWCWTPEGGDQGSQSEWSRDMAIAGLFPWALLTGRRDVLEHHAVYGRANRWFLGGPVSDGRTYYTPQMRGILFRLIESMGGKQDLEAIWPSIWPAGLHDYEGHLQVMQIWLQGEAAKRTGDTASMPQKPAEGQLVLDISGTMYQRLEEHAADEPQNPLYAYVLGRYTGDQSSTLNLLMDPAMPLGSYVRCTDLEQCQLAEWLFAASLLLRDFGRL